MSDAAERLAQAPRELIGKAAQGAVGQERPVNPYSIRSD
jgi:hypothetical protein